MWSVTATTLVVDREPITGRNPASERLIAASLVEALNRVRGAA